MGLILQSCRLFTLTKSTSSLAMKMEFGNRADTECFCFSLLQTEENSGSLNRGMPDVGMRLPQAPTEEETICVKWARREVGVLDDPIFRSKHDIFICQHKMTSMNNGDVLRGYQALNGMGPMMRYQSRPQTEGLMVMS